MRFNKTFLPVLLAASIPAAVAFQPALAMKPKAQAQNQEESKNEGRKLSMTLPGIGTANITVIPAQNLPASHGKPLAPARHLGLGQMGGFPQGAPKDVSIETKGNNITVRVPASVDAAIEDAQTVTRQIGRNASNGLAGASRFVDMMVLYFKQWTGSTTITPGGYPYVEKSSYPMLPTTIASGHKLYFTGEGRLKSVVNR